MKQVITLSRRDLLLVLALVGAGCRKPVPPPIVWHGLGAGEAKARAEKRLAILLFGAGWSAADVELERQTFPDPEVRSLVQDVVLIKIDMTDDENRDCILAAERFKVVGTPAVIGIDWLKEREFFRLYESVPASVLARHIREMKRSAT